MDGKEKRRRKFLKNGVVLAGAAVAAAQVAKGQGQTASQMTRERLSAFRPRSEPSSAVTISRTMPPETPGLAPLQDLVGVITPNELHFVNTHYNLPQIDPDEHRLMIHGMVDRPLVFTMDELKRLPAVSRVHFLECNDNSALALKGVNTAQAHGRTSCAEWTGVLLSTLLKEAGVQPGAGWLLVEGNDSGKHSKSFPLEKAMLDTIVAYGQNGEPLRPENGFPLRLVIPGFSGVHNVKWLRRIKVVDEPYMTKSEVRSYASVRLDGKARWFMFEMPPKSLVTRPSGGQRLSGPGFHEIIGLAWSGRGAVRKVEVSTDNGATWHNAPLQGPVHRIAHTRFRYPWTWDGTPTVLMSRCEDDLGQTQPSLAELSEVWKVDMDYWKQTRNPINIFNAIQPWKISADGSIDNAMA